jgi:hypothetical protein
MNLEIIGQGRHEYLEKYELHPEIYILKSVEADGPWRKIGAADVRRIRGRVQMLDNPKLPKNHKNVIAKNGM